MPEPDPAEAEPVGSFLAGLIAGLLGRASAEGLLRVDVWSLTHASPDLWQLDLRTESGLRYRLDLHALTTEPEGTPDAT